MGILLKPPNPRPREIPPLQTDVSSQFRAEVEHVSYRNEENGWTVLRARRIDSEQVLTATGHFAAVRPGDQFEFIGNWGKHPQYGPQFKLERVVPVRPNTGAAIEKYLASGQIKGIGPKTAAIIVKHFGENTLDILDQNPKRLLEVPSIGAKKADVIMESWGQQRGVAEVMMFLNTHNISPLFATRIFKFYGPEAIRLVSADPYQLAIDIQGIGFLSADRVARSMGIAADSPTRIRAATLYQLQQGEEKGHCYLTTPQLLRELVHSLALSENTVLAHLATALSELHSLGALITETIDDPVLGKVPAHYRTDLLAAEQNVADYLATLLNEPLKADTARIDLWLQRYAEASGTKLSEEQLEAVAKAANSRVFVLTGGPGVGKTTTANTIIRLLKAMGKQVALGAPTGRAAQRLTEVSSTPARTIHRMLEWVPALNAFSRDETTPLTVQAVIVDEASMLDIRLADALVRAVPKTAQLILLGDVDQLPSVGPGNVLRDLIDTHCVPCTRLTQIFRQAQQSQIVRTAHAINRGELPELSNESDSDCRFIECETSDDIREIIKDLMHRRLADEFGFDAMTEAQVLTPMNRGDLGTQALNAELQELLNPARPDVQEYRRGQYLLLRPGDRVIQSANNYDLGVFNGDIGYVRHTKVDGGKLMVAFSEERMITYDDEGAIDLRLAYAITIHKSQGSEFPVVIIPSTMAHFIMLQRNLMYTALTRARRLAIFVGSRRALAHAVNNQTSLTRQTSLIQRLKAQLP